MTDVFSKKCHMKIQERMMCEDRGRDWAYASATKEG